MREKILNLFFSGDKSNIRLAIMLNKTEKLGIDFDKECYGLCVLYNTFIYKSSEKLNEFINVVEYITNKTSINIISNKYLEMLNKNPNVFDNISYLHKIKAFYCDATILSLLNFELPKNITELAIFTNKKDNKHNEYVIPKIVANLPLLQHLTIKLTKLCKLPRNINELQQIKALEIINSKLQNIDGLQLHKLEKLILLSNNITNLDGIEKFKKLKMLQVEQTNMKEIPPSVCCLHNLEDLIFSSNDIAEIPSEISQLKNLQYLSLSFTQIKDISTICNLKKLKILRLVNTNVTYIPKKIVQLENLKMLHISLQNHTQIQIPIEIQHIFPSNVVKYCKYIFY